MADEVRGILDGHIVLSRALAERGHWPAIDVLASLSRLMRQLTSSEQQHDASALRRLLATYESQRDLILLGAYQAGSDRRTDQAIAAIERIEDFLQQRSDECADREATLAALKNAVVG